MNDKQRPPIATLLRTLAELFPVFVAEPWRPHKALAIGIDKHLVEAGVLTADECHTVFFRYTHRRMYQVALAAGGYRHNLDGTVAGEISAEHRAGATALLAHMDAKATKAATKMRADRKAAWEADKAKARTERQAVADASKGPTPDHTPRTPVPVTNDAPSLAPSAPRRLSLADLRAAAQERKAAAAV
jgi:sRNA-binding protein